MESGQFKGAGAGVVGAGFYAPGRVVTNADLEKTVDTSDEWIVQRTGIHERRVASEGETTTAIAVAAAKAALADAGVDGSKVGLVVVATSTPDYYSPPTATAVQHAIGAGACAAFDIGAGCSGSLFAIVAAEQFIRSGACEYALVVGAETLSRLVDWKDRRTCIVFGDGAGAALLGRAPEGRGILCSCLMSDGGNASLITIPGLSITEEDLERRGGVKKATVWMEGGKVLKFASRAMASAVQAVLAKSGVSIGDVRLVIPHQANLRIIDNAARRLGLRQDQVYVNIGKYGNTSAASVLIAIAEALAEGRVASGDYVVLVAFGAGLLYGAALMRWI